ncbi:PI-PLC domain-containing protein, partial [Flavobacterium chungangense]
MRKNHANWMGDLMNNNSPFINHPLNSIIIPGTHDSGTMTLDTRARTQTLNIKEQLEHGVRYFDFRIKLSGNKYYFHHTLCSDDVLCEKKIDFTTPKSDYALHQIRNFLIEQPNEIIILKFQNFLNLT